MQDDNDWRGGLRLLLFFSPPVACPGLPLLYYSSHARELPLCNIFNPFAIPPRWRFIAAACRRASLSMPTYMYLPSCLPFAGYPTACCHFHALGLLRGRRGCLAFCLTGRPTYLPVLLASSPSGPHRLWDVPLPCAAGRLPLKFETSSIPSPLFLLPFFSARELSSIPMAGLVSALLLLSLRWCWMTILSLPCLTATNGEPRNLVFFSAYAWLLQLRAFFSCFYLHLTSCAAVLPFHLFLLHLELLRAIALWRCCSNMHRCSGTPLLLQLPPSTAALLQDAAGIPARDAPNGIPARGGTPSVRRAYHYGFRCAISCLPVVGGRTCGTPRLAGHLLPCYAVPAMTGNGRRHACLALNVAAPAFPAGKTTSMAGAGGKTYAHAGYSRIPATTRNVS